MSRGAHGPAGQRSALALALLGVLATVAPAAAQVTAPGATLSGVGAQDLLSMAEDAMTGIEYAQSRGLAEQAIARGALSSAELARAYRLVAVACAQLDDNPCAEAAFLRLFALDPGSNVATRLSPAKRSAALGARGFWAVRKESFGLEVNFDRRERQLIVAVRDPLKWARAVHVWSRVADQPYRKQQRSAAAEQLFAVEVDTPTDTLEVYAFVVDEHDNVLMQLGREREPRVFGLSSQELDAFLRRDIRGGQTGSYARRLEELGVQVGVHGYASLEYKPVGNTQSFDLHHATAMIRASLMSRVSLEMALEWEHLGLGDDGFYLPHAFVDLKASEQLILRAGFFEVPVGAFNEYLYPDFLRITGLPPHFSRGVVPALWSEVGVQLRGRFALGGVASLTYAAFVSNGLEQADAMPGDGIIAEGGDIAEMRFHDRDRWSGDKAVGGRLGLELGEFDFGVSGYSGRYTVDGKRRLHLADTDFSYRGERLTVRSEGALALQDTTAELLRKFGLYALVAVRVWPHLEPYAQYDVAKVETRIQRALVGLASYPFPHDRATRNLRLKSEVGYDFPRGSRRKLVWFFQLTTGF
jgi:hypothetical protein